MKKNFLESFINNSIAISVICLITSIIAGSSDFLIAGVVGAGSAWVVANAYGEFLAKDDDDDETG